MAEFTDTDGRVWHPKLDLDACERFEVAVGESFFGLAHKVGPQELAASVRYCVPLLWACVHREAEQRSLGYTDFRAGMDNGDVLASGVVAMSAAMRDFFPTAGAAVKKAARKKTRKPRPAPGPGKTSGSSPPSRESNTPDA